MSEDYYSILGVNKGATDAEIKSAFRKLAMKYHPDKNPGDKAAEQKFKEINEAYETLKDPQKKAAYDSYGHDAYKNAGSGFSSSSYSGGNPFSDFGFGGGSSFSDIFEDLFRGATGGSTGKSSSVGNRGSDLRYNVELTLEEAYQGKKIELTLKKYDTCDGCSGTGCESGSNPEICPICHGSGVVRTQQGFFAFERTCSRCSGTGKIIKNPCKKCGGSGRMYKNSKVSVTIPSGIDDGVRIRVQGAGEAGTNRGGFGDLYIYTKIKPHNFFKRDGKDLHCEVPISMVKAAIGSEIEVPGIDGIKSILKIPEGTQNGQIFRLRQKGMKTMRGSIRGDMFVHVHVETPQNLTVSQKNLLMEFDKISDNKRNSPKSETFWEKLKDIWK